VCRALKGEELEHVLVFGSGQRKNYHYMKPSIYMLIKFPRGTLKGKSSAKETTYSELSSMAAGRDKFSIKCTFFSNSHKLLDQFFH
jgi:hypothetical protein